MLSEEAANTNFNVFGLTQLGIDPMTFHTWNEHANHYTIEAMIQINERMIQIALNLLVHVIPNAFLFFKLYFHIMVEIFFCRFFCMSVDIHIVNNSFNFS